MILIKFIFSIFEMRYIYTCLICSVHFTLWEIIMPDERDKEYPESLAHICSYYIDAYIKPILYLDSVYFLGRFY